MKRPLVPGVCGAVKKTVSECPGRRSRGLNILRIAVTALCASKRGTDALVISLINVSPALAVTCFFSSLGGVGTGAIPACAKIRGVEGTNSAES